MPVDTRRKRGSVYQLPPLTILPAPDSTIDAQDRMVVSWLYGGIAPAAPSVISITSDIILFDFFIDQQLAGDRFINQTEGRDVFIDQRLSKDFER